MTQKHTPEPWAVIDRLTIQGPRVAGDSLKCGLLVASLPHWCEPGDARRIVACVNACAGWETSQLEAMEFGGLKESLVRVMQRRDELQAQADELLCLLKSLENDAGQIPQFMWTKIQHAVKKHTGETK